MPTSSEYKERRKARKAKRDATAARLKKWVSLIEVLCKKYGISMTEIPGGHQFRVHEYIMSWWLTTNKIVIQYVGSDDVKEFDGKGEPGEPKILTALKKLVNVTKGDAPSMGAT